MKTKSLISIAAGIAGGIVGTMFIQQVTKLGGKLPKQFQPRMKGNPADVVFDKAEDLTGRELTQAKRDRLEPALPYIYGVAGPLVLGALAHKLGNGSVGRTLGAGAVMGAIVWAVGFLGWMPRSGVAEPIQRQPIGATANGLVGHALYGVVSALPVAFVERFV